MGRKPYLRLEWNEHTNQFVESLQRSTGDPQFSESMEAFQESNVKSVVEHIRQRVEQSSGIRKTQDRVLWIWINILIVVFGYAAGFIMMLRKHYMWAIIFLGGAPTVSFIIITYRSLVKDRWDQVNKWLDKHEGWILENSKSAGLAVSWFFAKEGKFLINLEASKSPQESATVQHTSCFSKKPGVFGYIIFTLKNESRPATLGSRRSIEKELVTSAQKPVPNMVKPSSSGEIRPKLLRSKFDPKLSSAPQAVFSRNETAKVVTTKLPMSKPSNSPPNNPLKPKSLMTAPFNGKSANKLLPNSSSRALGELPEPGDPRKQISGNSMGFVRNSKPSNSRRPSVQRQPSQQQIVEVLKPSLHKGSNLRIPCRESDEKLPHIQQDESCDGSHQLDESANQSRMIGLREDEPSQRGRNTFLVTELREHNDSIDNFAKLLQDRPYQSQSNMAEPAVSVGQGSTKETSQPTAGILSKGSSSKLRLNPSKQSSAPVERLPGLQLQVKDGVFVLKQPDSSARKLINKHLPKPGISVNRESVFSAKEAPVGPSLAN